MKRCPQCGAEYDDYVQYCFVDGAELTEATVGAPPVAAKRSVSGSTPVPVPPTGPPPPRASAVPPPVQRPPVQESARGLSIWALVFLFLLVITLFGVGGVVGALVLIGGSGPTAQPVEVPRPAPLPPPPPEPVPVQENVIQVRFESEPPGAEVWEKGTLLCSTPCDVRHSEFAPEERDFVLKAPGFLDTPYTMTDASAIQVVPLSKPRPKPPKPRVDEGIIISR